MSLAIVANRICRDFRQLSMSWAIQ